MLKFISIGLIGFAIGLIAGLGIASATRSQSTIEEDLRHQLDNKAEQIRRQSEEIEEVRASRSANDQKTGATEKTQKIGISTTNLIDRLARISGYYFSSDEGGNDKLFSTASCKECGAVAVFRGDQSNLSSASIGFIISNEIPDGGKKLDKCASGFILAICPDWGDGIIWFNECARLNTDKSFPDETGLETFKDGVRFTFLLSRDVGTLTLSARPAR